MSAAAQQAGALPAWADWAGSHELGPYTVGIEEEVMLLDQLTWALAHRIDSVLPRLPHGKTDSFTAETHGSALEIQTGVHAHIGEAIEELELKAMSCAGSAARAKRRIGIRAKILTTG